MIVGACDCKGAIWPTEFEFYDEQGKQHWYSASTGVGVFLSLFIDFFQKTMVVFRGVEMTKVEPSSKFRALAGMVRIPQNLYIDGKYSPARSGETFENINPATAQSLGQVAPTAETVLALIVKEPNGVAGVVLPWNFRLLTAAWKVAGRSGSLARDNGTEAMDQYQQTKTIWIATTA
jgi:hypothetical protein